MSNWRNTSKYRKWRKGVLEKDGNRCVITGSKRHLHAHHINHATYFVEERFDVSNGVTLHKWVHLFFHIFLMRGYRKKCTRKDWDHFLKWKSKIKFPDSLI